MNKNDRVYIANGRCRPYGLLSPQDDVEFLQALRAASRGDWEPLRKLKREGRARLLEQMSRAEVLHLTPRGAVVEILDGSDAGDFAWVAYRDLVERHDDRLATAHAYRKPGLEIED